MKCAFFGSRCCPDKTSETLLLTIKRLIASGEIDEFFVGNQGKFDSLVLNCFEKLKRTFPHIKYSVVLAYFPKGKNSRSGISTVFPEGLENVPPKFAIIKRNLWMLDKSDIVVVCVSDITGNAARLRDAAVKKGKRVIEI